MKTVDLSKKEQLAMPVLDFLSPDDAKIIIDFIRELKDKGQAYKEALEQSDKTIDDLQDTISRKQTNTLECTLSNVKDEDALYIGKSIIGMTISDESIIHQVKNELLSSPNFWNAQTSLSGSKWLKIFQYLQMNDYQINALY